jgi:thioredoxin-related protein
MKISTVAMATLVALSTIGAAVADEPATSESGVPPEVNWKGFDEALENARAADKHIMVDVYTDWCGWCKRLDKETYADFSVREVLAESFVSAKVKGDSQKRLSVTPQISKVGDVTLLQFVSAKQPTMTEKELTQKQLKITGFPTILFFSADGKLITKLPGFYDADKFKNILNFVKDDLYEVMSYQDYLESLIKAEESTTQTKS